jgi:hypothetical protein
MTINMKNSKNSKLLILDRLVTILNIEEGAQ